MPRDRFIEPQTTRIELTDDDWIVVKHRITEGERLRLEGATLARMRAVDGEQAEIGLDWPRFRIQRIVTWVVEWSFRHGGKAVPITRDSVSALDPETAAEIQEALDVHIAGIEESKKAATAGTKSART